MDIHSGHRKRTKEKYLNSLGEDFNDHELLELLLFYAIPRKNTNETAHLLMEKFGSVENIVEASIEDLKTVDGIGDNSAILIKTVLAFSKRYTNNKKNCKKRLNTIDLAVDYANLRTMGAISELVYATYMDNSLNVIDTVLISVGAIDEAKPLVRTIIELALIKHATAVMLVHNHPRGGVEASPADVDFTILLERELHLIGINFVEHLIVDGKGYNPLLKDLREVMDVYRLIDLNKFY